MKSNYLSLCFIALFVTLLMSNLRAANTPGEALAPSSSYLGNGLDEKYAPTKFWPCTGVKRAAANRDEFKMFRRFPLAM